MELVWEDTPLPVKASFFTSDVYDKYSLAPSIQELWAIGRSPTLTAQVPGQRPGATKRRGPPSSEEAEGHGSNVDKRAEESACWDNCHSDGSSVDPKDSKKSKAKNGNVQNQTSDAYPEPRVPFPCTSSLSSQDHKRYLGSLRVKNPTRPPQDLTLRVKGEAAQFTRYLQDVSRMCAEDYNYISQGALRYSEEFLGSCLEQMRAFPQVYQIHEMTSLTGGSFNPGLTLTFEKQLLVMGNMDITDYKIVPTDTQLASDYETVSSQNPPAKKAKDKHATISGDSNAERLCAHYRPHVCLTQDALVRLLDNHGPEFSEPWELPVWVKTNPGKGSSQWKTVLVDSPLLKTEMTLRERSHIYHEESLKLSIIKTDRRNVTFLNTEVPAAEKQVQLESSQRCLVSLESTGLDFDVDLTDLETFGETTTVKPPKKTAGSEREQSKSVPREKTLSSLPRRRTRGSALGSKQTDSSSQEEENFSSTSMEDSVKEEPAVISEPSTPRSPPRTKRSNRNSARESEKDATSLGDSEDERLVIDDPVFPPAEPSASSQDAPSAESIPDTPQSPTPKSATGPKRGARRPKVPGDQLGEILRMQKAMLKPAKDPAKCAVPTPEPLSPPRPVGDSGRAHPTSLVKPCVSSYLESNQDRDGETYATVAPAGPASVVTPVEQKELLSQDLRGGAEDEQDYKAPEQGNLLYKLYGLQDQLLMVRSSVPRSHGRRLGDGTVQNVPIYVLPKLEYQLCHGVERLTSSESCQLWVETALHSTTVSYIAHINAHTSKVALLRKLPDDWQQKISCGFKPSKSLNILHHLLKKITGLEEGRYLIGHKAGEPFVTILKTAEGNQVRRGGAYDLQQIHGAPPRPPASGPVPWVPVDPTLILPVHQRHGRLPCAFPPHDLLKVNAGGTKTKKRLKRATRRKKWMEKTIQKSIENPQP